MFEFSRSVRLVAARVVAIAGAAVVAMQFVSPVPAQAAPRGLLGVTLIAIGPASEEQLFVARVRLGCNANNATIDVDVLVESHAGRLRFEREVRNPDGDGGTRATVQLKGRADADGAVYAGTIQANIVEYDRKEVVFERCERGGDWSAPVTPSTATGHVIRDGPMHDIELYGGETQVDVAGSSTTVDVLSGIQDDQPVLAHAELDDEEFRWTVDAPEYANGIGAGDRSIWVVSGDDGSIARLRRDDGEKVLEKRLGDSYDCCSVLSPPVAVTPDAVFAPGGDFPAIERFDARTGSHESLELEFGNNDYVGTLATHGDDLYATVEREDDVALVRVDPSTGATLASRSLGEGLTFVDVELRSDGTSLWGAFMVPDEMTVVERLDPVTLAAVARVVLPEWGGQLAVSAPGFWLAHICDPEGFVNEGPCGPAGDLAGGEVVAYDATTLAPTRTIPLRGVLTAAGGRVWLFNSELGALIELG